MLYCVGRLVGRQGGGLAGYVTSCGGLKLFENELMDLFLLVIFFAFYSLQV